MKQQQFKPDFRRIDAVLRGNTSDVVPLFEYFADPEVIERITGKPYGPASAVEFYYSLGYDYVHVPMNLVYPMHKRAAEDTAELSRGQRTFNDSDNGVIESRADFSRYDWPEIGPAVARSIVETEKLLPDNVKMIVDIQPGGVQETAIALMGYYAFSYALYEDEQLIWDVFERLSDDLLRSMEICFESALGKIGAVVYGDDMGYNSGTIISPEFMRKYTFPFQKLHAECAHRRDIPFILHSCGGIDAVMEDLINSVGIDAKHSFQEGASDIIDAKQKYGSRIALLGGVDMHKLCTLKESDLRAYVRQVFEACAPDRFAIGSGNSIANYVPLQNYLIMLDECNRLRFA